MGTGRYVQKRGHYSKGVTYSVEEENPDQTVFLNDLKIPGGLEGRVLAGGEILEHPHFGQPRRAAHIKPGPVRAAAGTWGCATHPMSRAGTEARPGGRCDPQRLGADHCPFQPEGLVHLCFPLGKRRK